MATTGARLTWDEFLAHDTESRLAEWVDGEVVEYVPPNYRHQAIAGFLFHLLGLFVDRGGLGRVVQAPFAMRLTPDGNAREPDLLFVSRHHEDRLVPTHLDGPADLAIEIVSQDSVVRDRVDKFDEYQQAGVAEYWVIDARPGRERADFWVLDAHGRYRPVAPDHEGVFRSTVVAGFWLRAEWMHREPLPKAEAAPAEVVGPTA